jgi:hypothetical protein
MNTENTKSSLGWTLEDDNTLFSICVNRICTDEGLSVPTYGISRKGFRKNDISTNIILVAHLVDKLNREKDIADYYLNDLINEFVDEFC